jgi:hypothetical protein
MKIANTDACRKITLGKHINEENCNNIFNNIWKLTDKSVDLSLKNFARAYVHNKVIQNGNGITNIRL